MSQNNVLKFEVAQLLTSAKELIQQTRVDSVRKKASVLIALRGVCDVQQNQQYGLFPVS